MKMMTFACNGLCATATKLHRPVMPSGGHDGTIKELVRKQNTSLCHQLYVGLYEKRPENSNTKHSVTLSGYSK